MRHRHLQRRAAVVGVVLALLPSLCQAQATEFKGIALGAQLADIQARIPKLFCNTSPGERLADVSCSIIASGSLCLRDAECLRLQNEILDVAGGKAEMVSFYFYGTTLGSISVAFPESSHSRMLAAAVVKFGEPTRSASSILETNAGVKVESIATTWQRADGYIELRQRSGRIDRSNITYRSSQAIAEYQKRMDASPKKDASKL